MFVNDLSFLFIQIRRPRTAPIQFGENDDTLIIPQDFNTAMHEVNLLVP